MERLREIFRELAAQGAHNIDLVNPTHYAHAIAQALETPLPVPVVWNSGGYDRVETLRALEGKIDIYLPDYKYPDAAGAKAYAGAADYPPRWPRRPSGRWSARRGPASLTGRASCGGGW